MSWELVRANTWNVKCILDAPSETTKREMQTAGVTGWQLLKGLHAELAALDSPAIVLQIDGEPVFAFGHGWRDPQNKKVRTTWFFSTPRFATLGARGVLFCKGIVNSLTSRWPGVTFECMSYSDHPAAERWFKLLGFTPSYAYDLPEGCRRYAFTATSKKGGSRDTRRVSC